jgi:hypothetical protein
MRTDLTASLDGLVFRDRVYSPWFSRCKKVEVTNCVSNILSPIADPFRDNVLIIGDAAWTMEFSNMAALCCGWKAGHAMTLALIDGKCSREGLSPYCTWWQNSFYGPYGSYDFGPAGGGGGILQAFLFPEELDYLVSLVPKPFPGTMNFFTLFDTIGSTYGELFPRIEAERPEVMEKLFAIREKLGEIGEGIRQAGFPNR